jgi:O-Antigen ligase
LILSKEKYNQYIFYIYLFGLAAICIGMPTSTVVMSIGSFIILGAWLLHTEWSEKFNRLKSNRYIWLLVGFFFLHLLGLLNTTNFKYAINDIRIKLPLFIFPIVMGSMPPINAFFKKIIIHIFIFSVLISSLVSFYTFLFNFNPLIDDVHEISGFVSHIRLSLMVVISIMFLIYFSIGNETSRLFKFIYLLLVLWFIYFLYILQSATGWVCLFGGLLFFGLWVVQFKTLVIRSFVYAFILLSIFSVGLFLNTTYKNYQKTEIIDLNHLESASKNGEFYLHDLNNKLTENGNYIYIYMAPKELEETWNQISEINYFDFDNKRQPVRATIIRYLASKGLKKDKEALLSLKKDEIKDIESGKTSYIQGTQNPIIERLNKLFFEFNSYADGGNPSGHSATQRIEYLKAGFIIAKKNLLFGVGTGDVQDAFNNQYETSETKLSKSAWHRAHNQYLTVLLSLGIFSFAYFLSVLIYPFLDPSIKKDFYFLSFYLVILFSFLNEDTLETQAGITLFAFFSCFFTLTTLKNNISIGK